MGSLLNEIDVNLAAWIHSQHLFFVSTAPLSVDGHINCSPKGGDTFRVLGEHEVAYLDYTGSGAETAAHLNENGRIVIMFCAFEGKANIVRLHGRGKVVLQSDPLYQNLMKHFKPHISTRSIMHIQVERISSSCGFGVPIMEYKADRDQIDTWAERKGITGLEEYRDKKNRVSIDGLPAFECKEK